MHLPKYENKPFKPPRRITSNISSNTSVGAEREKTPEVKRRKIFTTVQQDVSPQNDKFKNMYTAMFRKPSNKKHKTWSGDGYALLKIESNKITFFDKDGKSLGSPRNIPIDLKDTDLLSDTVFRCGSWEAAVDYKITDSQEKHKAQKLFTKTESEDLTDTDIVDTECVSQITAKTAVKKTTQKSSIPVSRLFTSGAIGKFKTAFCGSDTTTNTSMLSPTGEILAKEKNKRKYFPVFDISKIKNPIIMNRSDQFEVDVIVDPLIGKFLRPHQREGVKFMYDCIMSLAQPETNQDKDNSTTDKSLLLEHNDDIHGCLLADEMGLGKTLMTITLVWTLLRQTPMASKVPCSQLGVPLQGEFSKFLIVCPVTLIGNWKKEFRKWLNLSRIGVLTLSPRNSPDKDKNDVKNFLRVQRTYQVLIIGYEKLLSVSGELTSAKDKIDMLICDEGHRLKNGSSKILNILKGLEVKSKIMLSGTPIQNDLNEFFTIVDFINPGILGSSAYFKKRYIVPITRARDTNNQFNQNILELGEERSKEMIEITQKFILRRTSNILSKYLPPRSDIILFCKPTAAQVSAFQGILQGAHLDYKNMTFNSSLGLITLMKKVCNSPSLIKGDSFYSSNIKDSNVGVRYCNSLDSGKLRTLMALLKNIRNDTEQEKVVIVSNYTQTLDIIEGLMRSEQMSFCRLDGSTPNKQRDSIINSFNNNPTIFAFLLSAKSGGVGLNLVGASRLILFDNDWNPSIDLQAMSRIHRDGQKRACFIYRLVTTGCIDEKILQRQLMKHSLSKKFLNDSNAEQANVNDDLFDKQDLKDLFTINIETKSNTHDLICSCDGCGEEVNVSEGTPDIPLATASFSEWTSALSAHKAMEESDAKAIASKTNVIKKCLIGYKHIDPQNTKELFDPITAGCLMTPNTDISFVFAKPSDLEV